MARVEDYKAKDIMSKNFISAKPKDTVSDIIGLMKKYDVAEIPVLKNSKIVGIVSEDTFVKKRHLPFSTKVENIMSTPPDVDFEDSIVDVSELLLSSGYRGVPVKSNKGEVVGFISRTDIIQKIHEMEDLAKTPVKDIMTPSPNTIGEHETIGKAKAMMEKLDVKAIPVVDKHNKLSGVIGIKDIIKETARPINREGEGRYHQAGEKSSPYQDIEIGSIMISPAITTTPNDDLKQSTINMIDNDISTIIVTEDDDIKGVLTQIDIIEMIASFREAEQVYVQITGLEEDPDIYEGMYELIQNYLQKINNVIKPLVLNVHVVTHRKKGHEKKYSIRLRLNTDHGMFYAKKFDWNIMRALDDGLSSLKRTIFEGIEKNRDKHRRHPKYRSQNVQ
ncbi:MAG: CBS domain-containing protein [Thermoplasmatota archaeon]